MVFTNQNDAESSLDLNGHQLNENHLRVNMANQYKFESNNKGTIFVGNLPFKATETDVHGHFTKVGNIEYVRILPNKGIAYICFKKGTNMADAVKFNKPFGGRTLRIERYVSKVNISLKQNELTTHCLNISRTNKIVANCSKKTRKLVESLNKR